MSFNLSLCPCFLFMFLVFVERNSTHHLLKFYLFCLFKVCAQKEKNRGCLCLTPTALEPQGENKKRMPFSDEHVVMPDQAETMSSKQPELSRTNIIDTPRKTESTNNITDESVVIYLRGSESSLSTINSPVSTVTLNLRPNDEECNANIDFSDCIASVNANNLKMLSLLDFAGQSACHHIFFSPRAFFILVFDMTKPFEQIAHESCMEKNLIYSNWTYAGN